MIIINHYHHNDHRHHIIMIIIIIITTVSSLSSQWSSSYRHHYHHNNHYFIIIITMMMMIIIIIIIIITTTIIIICFFLAEPICSYFFCLCIYSSYWLLQGSCRVLTNITKRKATLQMNTPAKSSSTDIFSLPAIPVDEYERRKLLYTGKCKTRVMEKFCFKSPNQFNSK